MRVICLSGPDGVGKTSILEQLGVKRCTLWMRGGHGLAFLFLKFFEKVGAFDGNCVPNFSICLKGPLSRVWWVIELVSYLPLLLARLILLRLRRCPVVYMDRCPIDLAVWTYALTRRTNEVLIMITLSLTFLFDSLILYAPKEVLKNRKGEEFREQMFEFYKAICYSNIIKCVDASKPLEAVAREVAENLGIKSNF